MEIKPGVKLKQNVPTGTNSETHNLEVKMTWTPKPNIQVELRLGNNQVPILDRQFSYSGSAEVSAQISTEYGNSYSFGFSTSGGGWANGDNIVIDSYLDGKPIQHDVIATAHSGYSYIDVVFPECGDNLPLCTKVPELPILKVIVSSPGAFNQNPCILKRDPKNPLKIVEWDAGVTRPVQGSHMFNQPYPREACYDKDKGKWQFNVGPFELNIISGLCLDNIEIMNLKVINSMDELDQIPDSEICDALNNVVGHMVYPYDLGKGDYIFTEIILKHEEMHVSDIKKIFSNYLPEIRKELNNINITCSDAGSESEALDKSLRKISNIFSDKFGEAINDYNDNTTLNNEINVNERDDVFNLQIEYYTSLELKAFELGLDCK